MCRSVCVQYDSGEYVMDKKELGAYKKMSPEDVQGMLHLRRRAHKQKNKKAYNRKKKHKESEE